MTEISLDPNKGQTSPVDIDTGFLTIGQPGLKIPPELVRVAKSTNSERALESLLQLTGHKNSLTHLGSIVSLLSQKEIILILSRWSDCDPYAAALEIFGRGTWMYPGLADQLRPFEDDQKATRRLQGDLTEQYLAAMAAARRPVQKDQAMVLFIQRLRSLCVVRAFSAQDQFQISREKSLQQVCAALRLACDHPVSDQLDWLRSILSLETQLDDLASDVQIRCTERLKQTTGTSSQKQFYRALIKVAADGPWRSTHDFDSSSSLPANLQLRPPLTFRGEVSHQPFLDLLDPVYEESDDGEAGPIQPYLTDQKNTAARNTQRGRGLMLEHIEDVQFLRQTWHHLSVEEEHLFLRRIEALLASNRRLDRIGATMVLIGCITSRSMTSVGQLQICKQPSDDWAIDPHSCELHRRPPRFMRRWRAESLGQDQLHWLNPMAGEYRIRLCERAASELAKILPGADRSDISEIWNAVSNSVRLETWFNECFLGDSKLVHLGAPSSARVLQVHAFDKTFNHSFVRLLGAQNRTALPSACTYGAYGPSDIHNGLSIGTAQTLFTIVEPPTDRYLNCCGSELDVLPHRIHEAISGLIARVNAAAIDQANWVESHNLLTSLCVISLLASTGARPVHSPFESLAGIDMERRLLLVEDKVSGPTRGSRLCVLSDFAHDLLNRTYLPHLRMLAESLSHAVPIFAGQLRRVLAQDTEAQVPLFLFLRDTPTLEWLEVTETQLQLESGVDWPLPWNVFRHLHSTELVRRGIDQEVVDAMLAHADGQSQSHGNYSVRVPLDDLKSARAAVNALQMEWGLDSFQVMGAPSPPRVQSVPEPSMMASRAFGRTARALDRAAKRDAAIFRAETEIKSMVGARPPSTLSPDDWHAVALTMLFREDKVRHPFASLRYEVFEKYLNSIWQEQRVLTRMRRGFNVNPPCEAFFNEDVIGAQRKLEELQAAFEVAQAALDGPRIGARHAGMLAAIELILHCGVAHIRALLDVLCLRPSVKLVKFQNKYWLERSYSETWKDGRPVFRVQVSGRAARWLAISTQGPNQLKTIPDIPAELEQLLTQQAGRSMKQLIAPIAALQDQLNALTLPGTDAAYLGGRLIFSAIPHRDWYRLHSGKAPICDSGPGAEKGEDDQGPPDEVPYVIAIESKAKQAATSGTSTPEKCAELFEAIRSAISKDTDHPKTSITAIEAATATSIYGHGDFPYVAASFICHLLARRPKKGQRDNLRTSTVRRIWYALFQPICDLAHDKNIYDLEDDEWTDLYSEMVEWWQKYFQRSKEVLDAKHQLDQFENAGSARLSDEERAAGAGKRTLDALREFHAYLELAFGADSPEWSEISDEASGIVGRPGLVLLRDYLFGLDGLVGGLPMSEVSDDSLRSAFVWFLCARFGVRLGEAVGLYRQDWIEIDGAIVIVIQANHVRPLKTPRSRRKIPLLETLTALERSLIGEVLRRWLIAGKGDQRTPLFEGLDRNSYRKFRSAIGQELGARVKDATRNITASLHMLRHSYASRVFGLLRGQSLGSADSYTLGGSEHVRRLLLGRNESDRRVLWSISRLLGHSSPAVSARCYLHGLDQWTHLVGATEFRDIHIRKFSRVIDLDVVDVDGTYGEVRLNAHSVQQEAQEGIGKLITYVRLRVQGHRADSAFSNSMAGPDSVTAFEGLLNRVCAKTGNSIRKSDPYEIPNSISINQWLALQKRVKHIQISQHPTLAFDALETVGRRRQIVLFRAVHFEEFAKFLSSTNIFQDDIGLIESRNLSKKLADWVQESKLINYKAPASEFGPTFQLDKAEFGDPLACQKDRVIAVPRRQGGSIHTTQVLLVLWLGWMAIRSTAPINMAKEPIYTPFH
ncbi:site-specific integrase [Roseateles albus]|uniref:Site-specific integrase n=1 Tax=Roseateles albus TaxID=2987525 RepID=A0ABT5KKK5_9BURK|nr:site-specific integrase [Roseateles albus]MDC8773356.1 site-specific integrase [Roseateles albus]